MPAAAFFKRRILMDKEKTNSEKKPLLKLFFTMLYISAFTFGDFVGRTGIIPITMLIEDVFGIEVNSKDNEIVWHINELSRHGIKNLPFGKDSEVTLICEKRNS